MDRNKKVRGVAIGIFAAILLLFAYLALLNGRYYFIDEENYGCTVFDKWRCKVIDVEYKMDE